MTIELVDQAVTAGARRKKACALLGLSLRTLQRWGDEPGEDQRKGPLSSPASKLSDTERREVLQLANSREFRDLPPSQIVPRDLPIKDAISPPNPPSTGCSMRRG